MTDERTPTPRADVLRDADKLRTLATWFDHFDDWREKTGKIAPGITDYREVQDDLRRIAARLDTAPDLDVERLAASWAHVMDGRRIGASPGLAARISGGTTNADDWQAIAAEYLALLPTTTEAPA